MKNRAAVSLGKASWKARKKKRTKKDMSAYMRDLALKRHGKLDTASL